ncbi:2Fe-2S iron-sulfur cluster binding domain-containing protein [Phaeobacter sp. J2-8]|uniref:FAD-binding oxidoreductase n=1 Tax=Phaeobacter sp. J2-8 TaxID=2931394 RepID=UPI001FD5B615|nr:2Fe-2S iron-sulfur cluster binding domain-containing protein [Phaeobacter sp. J2-8]MCJ7872302.1 2Fe-2S iron-sulfur cluster binding domain-containing protein [Phaeobacter sp. J2-8]
MDHSIKIKFSDGEIFAFRGDEYVSVLQSAEIAGLTLAKDCEMGDCQTCKCRLAAGEVELDELAFDTLEEDEQASGAMLSCVSLPRSDIEVDMPYARADLLRPRRLTAKVENIEYLSARTVKLTLRLTGGTRLEFRPGQYVNLTCDGVTRSYSMSNPDRDDRDLEFHIALLDDGDMSAKLRAIAVGASIGVEGPQGIFYLRKIPGPIVMIAGGTGIAPMLSMLRSLEADGKQDQKILLCYGANTLDDLCARPALRQLQEQFPNLDVRYAAVSDAAADVTQGYATSILSADEACGKSGVFVWSARNGPRRARFGGNRGLCRDTNLCRRVHCQREIAWRIAWAVDHGCPRQTRAVTGERFP